MNIYDLVFMACLTLGQGSDCKQQMLKCVLEIRDNSIKSYISTQDIKKMNPDQYLTTQPPADWQAWTLDCAQKQKSKIEVAQPKKEGNIKK